MKKILWLASWYPNNAEPLTGDFIERHARAASTFNDITVLFVLRDRSLKAGVVQRQSRMYNDRCRAFIIYYGADNKLQSLYNYFLLYKQLISEYVAAHGRPALAHVHVAFRAGLIALFLKWRYTIPYLITEHWSLFNDAANNSFARQPAFKRYIIKTIFRQAAACSVVSAQLAHSIRSKTGIPMPVVIPNVFDSSLFFLEPHQNSVFRFIHVSQLNDAKNAAQIVEAAKRLHAVSAAPFLLTIVGPSRNDIDVTAPYINHKLEMPQQELASLLRGHDALILYSKYEGLPCVVIEALACGLPVIGSNIPPMHELIHEGENGSLVSLNNPAALADTMYTFMTRAFDHRKIADDAYVRFNFEKIGKLFDELYRTVIPTSPKLKH